MKLLGIREFVSGVKKILKHKFDYLYLFFQLIVFTGLVKQVSSDSFLIFNLFFTVTLALIKGRNIFNPLLFRIVFIYALIIVIPVILYGFNSVLYIGFLLRLLTGFFIILYFRLDFLIYFENLVFVLAYLSIPLYLLQLVNRSFFDVFTRLSQLVLIPNYLELGDFRYFFIFLVNPGGFTRNSGFMWEPAAFGGTLAWAMLINLYQSNFKPNTRFITFLIAAITTFSVGTYVYLFFITLLFLNENRLKKGYIIIIPFVIVLILVYDNPFFQDQLEMMSTKVLGEPENVEKALSGNVEAYQVSRYAGIYIALNYFQKNPLGYGFASNNNSFDLLASSPNGLMHILVRWGIFGISIFFICVFRLVQFYKFYFSQKIRLFSFYLSILIFILPFTGNPFYHRPLLFSFLFLPFIYKKYLVQKNSTNVKNNQKNYSKNGIRHNTLSRPIDEEENGSNQIASN